MSDEIVEDDAKPAPDPKPAKKSKKKLLIIGAAAVLLLGGGGGAYMMFAGGSAKAETAEHSAPAAGGHGEEGAEAYVDVPAMVVNLRSPDGAARFLKIHLMLVPGPNGTVDGVTKAIPLLLDAYQPFLRELRPEDLAGSAAVFRIKEELLVRAAQAAGRGVVKDILIQDLVQQ